MSKQIKINAQTVIGNSESPYLIAEIGTNHDQKLEKAIDLIIAAADAGFDCAKFQTYEPCEIVSGGVQASEYGLDKYYGDISAVDMFEHHLKTPKRWFPKLKEICREYKIDCATTIHGGHGLSWANKIGFDLIKIASMDHNNFPFIKSLINIVEAPILISFGMAELDDIDEAISILERHQKGVGMFHCVSLYPPKPEELRLFNVEFFRDRYEVPVGFSDHADDVITSLAALALGASIFEKHITLDKNSNGPDHKFALEPQEMKSYVDGIKTLAGEKNSGRFSAPKNNEKAIRDAYMKSIVLLRDLPKGRHLKSTDLALIRPGKGLPPKEFDNVLSKKLNKGLKKGHVISWNDLDDIS